MRKIRNLVIGGIENKLFNLILFTVILLTGAFILVSTFQSRMLAGLANESNTRQQASMEEIMGSLMDTVVERYMDRVTELDAYIADDVFQNLNSRVGMLAEYAEKLFSDPDSFPQASYAAPDPQNEGTAVAQMILAEGVDPDEPALLKKMGMIANMSDLMVSLFNTSEQVNSCFIALPDGAFLIADDRSGQKFDSRGNRTSYDPRTRPWYQQAVESGGMIFTDVETDAFTGDIGIVGAMPVYVDGQLAAVVGSDLFLTAMQEAVQASEEDGAFLFVVNQYGHIVFSPKTEGTFQVLHSSEAADLRQSANTDLASLIRDSMLQKTDVRVISLDEGTYYMLGAPMHTLGWSLISVFGREFADEPAKMLRRSYDQIQEETTASYRRNTSQNQRIAYALLLAVVCLMLAGALILGKKIVQPLNTITKRISQLNENNVEFKMENAYKTGDEIEVLAQSFAWISHKTVEYVEEVKQVTAEKERIGTELALATRIQAAMLPHIFPAFPDRPDFDIYASMAPAKEVGGDFYDYFLVDDDHLCMLIADVAGKGVPAALFMMAGKIMLQSYAMMGLSVTEVLTKTNEAICSNNEAEMFVTVWIGILELSTGKMTASNAGHEYPVLKKGNRPFEIVKDKHGFVVGAMEGMVYREYELFFEPGDKLFVYTDGVAEATNQEDVLYGTKRMVAALNKDPEASPYGIMRNVYDSVREFVGEADQFDDLTMLCLEYKGPQAKKTEYNPDLE